MCVPMKLNSSGQSYSVSRAVEEPLEATFELGEDISKLSEGLRRPVRLGILGCIILILFLLPSIYYLSMQIYELYLGSIEVTTWAYWNITAFAFLIIILFSIITTTIVYLIQVNEFNTHLLQRYSLIIDFKDAKPPKSKKIEEKSQSKSSLTRKHMKNPIYAMLDLVEESMHALPQIVKLVRFCTYFITVMLFYMFFWLNTRSIFSIYVPYDVAYWVLFYEIAVGTLAGIMFIFSIKLLLDSEKLFTNLRSRHDIIDSIRFEPNITIPEGKNQLGRVINYLTENDPYIKSSILVNDEKFKKNITMPGHSKGDHKFDAYFSGVNVLKSRSVGLGMPMGRFGVFVKVYKSEITLKKLKELRESVLDVCGHQEIFPLRIIILQWTVAELSDEVYNQVLENPIELKNTLTHLQVVAEDGDIYSFIPIISYGKEM